MAVPIPSTAPSHEATLLPLTGDLASELLRRVPRTAKLEALIFMAHFPQPGEVITAGVILHDLNGELRAIPITDLTDDARRLLTACSRYESGERLTSIQIKIAADGQCTTSFGAAPPLSAEGLKEHLGRLYGHIPEAPAPTLSPGGCLVGWLRLLFGPRLKRYRLPTLEHKPQRERLALFLDRFDGINEGWDDLRAAGAASSSSPRPPGPADGPGPDPSSVVDPLAGKHLVVPAEEGVLFAEARDIYALSLAALHKKRPTLRFDPIDESLIRDLGPGLGELRFGTWKGNIRGISLDAEGIPTFDALLARLEPVLAALGGMGPIVSAMAVRHPGAVREVIPVRLDELRAYLVADSPYGRRVYPCWLLGRPAHTKVGLDLSVGLTDGRPSFGYRVSVDLP